MPRIIAVANRKGGVGKTTTTVNIATAMAATGKKVLVVDLDPQGSLTQSAGLDDLTDEALTVYEVLAGADVNAAIQTKTTSTKYDVLPADIRLSAGEIELVNADRRNFLLRDALGRIRKQYDYILIDCPPSLNIFSLMALTAATEAIIPVQAQYLPLKGVAQLRDTINLVRQRFNPALKIAITSTAVSCCTRLEASRPINSRRNAFGQKYHLVRLPIPSMFQPDCAARIPPR